MSFEELLGYLQQCNGFDFTGYKREVLDRRIRLRMSKQGLRTFSAYLAYLKTHPDELRPLFDTILISVTDFFRDEPQWTYLQHPIFPKIVAEKKSSERYASGLQGAVPVKKLTRSPWFAPKRSGWRDSKGRSGFLPRMWIKARSSTRAQAPT